MSNFIQLPVFKDIQTALAVLSEVIGNHMNADGVAQGMPLQKGKLDPIYLEEAANRAGLSLNPISLDDAKHYHCPLILIHPDARAMLVVEIKVGGVGTAVAESGESSVVLLPELANQGFKQCWSVLIDRAADSRVEPSNEEEGKNWILQSLWMNKQIVGSVLAATVAINVLGLALPLITMNVLDRVVSHASFETLWTLALGGVFAIICEFALRSLRGSIIDKSSARSDVFLLNRIFRQIIGTKFSQKHSSVGVQTNTLREFESLREISNAATIATIGDLPFAVMFLLVIYFVAGPIVFVPIAVIPLLLLCSKATHGKLHSLVAKNFSDTAMKNAVAVEVLSNIETVRAHAGESWAAGKWERAVASQLRQSIAMRWYMALSTNLITALQGLTTIAILIVGVYLISASQMSAGSLFATSMLASRALSPIAQIAVLLSKIDHAKSAYKAIRKLVDAEQERPITAQFIKPKQKFSILSLENIEVSYRKDAAPALQKLDLRIVSGERIAIIGGIGSGKSTLLRLILGLIPPTSGSITMDEIPVQQIEPINYRQKFGVSFRDGGFFFGTVRDNMNFHRPNASDNELVEGARMSGALPWIHMQPSGFDTRVGEAGAGLSSGQRQTLALSRAFVGKSEILLLDEPTSDLDNRTENEFVNRLRQLPEDKTMIVVTHRPAVIDACHRLIVIDKGGILLDGEKSLVLARLKQINAAERAEGAA